MFDWRPFVFGGLASCVAESGNCLIDIEYNSIGDMFSNISCWSNENSTSNSGANIR